MQQTISWERIWTFYFSKVLNNPPNNLFYSLQVSRPTFAEILGVKWKTVSRQSLQQQLVAGPPARLRDAGSHALHRGNTLEKRWLAKETNQLVELGQDAVTLDLLLLR